ncbi:GNAT family N-acetyltransferase [Candidatus Woesearchaeota archaeon]|nr:GNAT family N-acetyltransferase [Candidatus Woesearchaeota archaeon]
MMFKKLEFIVQQRKPKMTEEYVNRVEETVFKALIDNEEIGYVVVDRFIRPNETELKDPFFTDHDFNPSRPRPYLFFMSVNEEHRGRKIAGKLVNFANEYYIFNYGTPLHSGTCNNNEAIRVWEKLVEQGKAQEYSYKGKRRWRLL